MSLISMIRTIRFPSQSEWRCIFHPLEAAHFLEEYAAMLHEREVMIHKLVNTVNAYTRREISRGPNLRQVMDLREQARTEGAVAAYRHLKKAADPPLTIKQMDEADALLKEANESPPLPNSD